MKYLPLFTQGKDQNVLIVGGGSTALRKARLVVEAGAKLTMLSRDFDSQVIELADKHQLQLVETEFDSLVSQQGLEQELPILVIAATNDSVVNKKIAQQAKQHNILVNVVDEPNISSFIFPSIIDRSPIVVAVSSGGDAPVLVRRLREKLEAFLPQHLGPLASLMGKFRQRAKQQLTNFNQRRQFWEAAVDSKVVGLVSAKQTESAQNELERQLTSAAQQQQTQGEVYIVGGGPGDPDLLTIKALQLMQQADVVVHDGLISAEVLNLVRRDAERINVSKSAGNHSVPQDQINQILIDQANKGLKVCRLKGGDPFIFGRGGEECEALVEAGISYQIVPGITAAAGCSAYAGIPLTHRDFAQGVQFVTGHCRKDGAPLDWKALAQPHQTLVFYMGLINSSDIVTNLIANGLDANTPVALVEKGTNAEQRIVTGQLEQLVSMIKDNQVTSPALIIIGGVVSLQQKLQWFGQQATTNTIP
jgi:uroporphyrin-III C-methyltransferase/precorrin-2 dehydrogenase/sirohydrochlorin ferrochelatase